MEEFLVLWLVTLATMLVCRCVPLFALKGRDLPERVRDALGLIPPAAFAALVANDLFSPDMFDAGLWPGLMPFVASAIVVVVAWRTRSLVWCVVTGVVAFVVLTLL